MTCAPGVNLTSASATGAREEGRGQSVKPPGAETPPAPGALHVLVRQQRLVRAAPDQVQRLREGTGCPTCGAP